MIRTVDASEFKSDRKRPRLEDDTSSESELSAHIDEGVDDLITLEGLANLFDDVPVECPCCSQACATISEMNAEIQHLKRTMGSILELLETFKSSRTGALLVAAP